jgi:hypothetical protein
MALLRKAMALLGRLNLKAAGPAPTSHHTVVTWEAGHVRTAVLRLSGGTGEILGLAAAPVQASGYGSHPDPDRWYRACDVALAQAEDMTSRPAGRKIVPDYVTMTIPSGVTRSLSIVDETRRRHSRRPISLDEMQTLLRRGYRKAQDRLDVRSRGSREDIIAGTLALITVDGQQVSDPVGMTGDLVQLNICFSLAPAEWIRSLQLIAQRLGLDLGGIVPHHVVLASPLADAASLLVVVDSSITTVDQVRRGRVEWVASIPHGAESLLAGTLEGLDVPDNQTEALMRAFRSGQLREDVDQRLSANYWRALRQWMGRLADQVSAVAPSSHLPFRVYSHDATGLVPEITPALATPFWEQRLGCARCPKVDALDPNGVSAVLDSTGQANGPAFLLLRSMVHYVARLYAPAYVLDRLLCDIVRARPAARG